jgi:hypothetical protein
MALGEGGVYLRVVENLRLLIARQLAAIQLQGLCNDTEDCTLKQKY